MITGLRALGLELTPKNFPIITDNHLVQWELCKLGVGICIVMDEVGDAEPRVRRVLPELPPFPVPVWLATHRELRTRQRIPVVFDLLAEELAKERGLGLQTPKRWRATPSPPKLETPSGRSRRLRSHSRPMPAPAAR